jgi:hypothetical protein
MNWMVGSDVLANHWKWMEQVEAIFICSPKVGQMQKCLVNSIWVRLEQAFADWIKWSSQGFPVVF